jgi:DNA-directed RNA polymerase III subunit RPC4
MDLDAIREVQDGGYISSDPDEAEEGKRRNIDHIDIVSDDEQPAEEGSAAEASTKERIISPSMAPIRLYRREHRDRAPPKNPESGDTAVKKENVDEDITTAADGTIVSVLKKGKQPEKDLEITGSSQSFQGVYSDDAAPAPPLIKEEPMEDVEEGTPAAGVFEDPKDVLDGKPKRVHKLGPKHSAPVLNTAEDHAEYDRYQDDLQSLTHELRHAAVNEAGELTEEDHKKERTYLFQFPPVVPDLVPQAPVVVKDEPTEELAAAPTETTITDPVAEPAAPIKIEDDAKDVSKRPPHLPKLASGLVGKMQVHKSGKVTLNWGGASLELHKGMDVTFLQDIVLVKRDAEVPQAKIAKGVVGGEAMAFGQVRGKFVVTPDWDDVLG